MSGSEVILVAAEVLGQQLPVDGHEVAVQAGNDLQAVGGHSRVESCRGTTAGPPPQIFFQRRRRVIPASKDKSFVGSYPGGRRGPCWPYRTAARRRSRLAEHCAASGSVVTPAVIAAVKDVRVAHVELTDFIAPGADICSAAHEHEIPCPGIRSRVVGHIGCAEVTGLGGDHGLVADE